MPDFIVMGAVKAGTTSLYHYLGQHPDIEMSLQNWPRFFHVDGGEPDFETLTKQFGPQLLAESKHRYRLMFHSKVKRDFDGYLADWPTTERTVKRGEVSPTYIHDASTFTRIKKRFPDVKLIVVLRQPVDRAFSHFVMDLPKGWVPERDFVTATQLEPVAINNFWWGLRHYVRHGIYAPNVEELQTVFDASQIKFCLYDDYIADPQVFLRDLLDFIGVDAQFEFDLSHRHNQGIWQVEEIDPVSKQKLIKSVKPKLDHNIRAEFTKKYRTSIDALEKLLGRDLSMWK